MRRIDWQRREAPKEWSPVLIVGSSWEGREGCHQRAKSLHRDARLIVYLPVSLPLNPDALPALSMQKHRERWRQEKVGPRPSWEVWFQESPGSPECYLALISISISNLSSSLKHCNNFLPRPELKLQYMLCVKCMQCPSP